MSSILTACLVVGALAIIVCICIWIYNKQSSTTDDLANMAPRIYWARNVLFEGEIADGFDITENNYINAIIRRPDNQSTVIKSRAIGTWRGNEELYALNIHLKDIATVLGGVGLIGLGTDGKTFYHANSIGDPFTQCAMAPQNIEFKAIDINNYGTLMLYGLSTTGTLYGASINPSNYMLTWNMTPIRTDIIAFSYIAEDILATIKSYGTITCEKLVNGQVASTINIPIMIPFRGSRTSSVSRTITEMKIRGRMIAANVNGKMVYGNILGV